MGVTGMLTSKEECSTCTNKAVTLVFGKSISVSREVLAYPLLSLLAEVDLCTHIHFWNEQFVSFISEY